MRLTLFGATGRTGQYLTEYALAAGHSVTVFARDAAKIKTHHAHLQILIGTVDNPVQVANAIQGSEAVVSVLGPTENKPTYAISKGTEHILTAMRQQGVRRLVLSVGAGVSDPRDAPGLSHQLIQFLLKTFARYVYEDMVRVAAQVRASDLDWTIVRVPRLTDAPPTKQIKVGFVGRGVGIQLSRADLAHFMLQQLTDRTYLRQAPAISN